MSFDPIEDQRGRDEEARREAERERERALREAERDRERAQRDAERERERGDRERDREQRREERRERHQERHQMRFGKRGFSVDVDVDPDEIARSISSAFVGMDEDTDGETYDDTVEKVFTVAQPQTRKVWVVDADIKGPLTTSHTAMSWPPSDPFPPGN